MSETAEVSAEVTHATGLHARPAALLVRTASAFPPEVSITIRAEGEGKPVNARSLMSVLALGVRKGTRVTIAAEGPGAAEAVQAIKNLINGDFTEEPG